MSEKPHTTPDAQENGRNYEVSDAKLRTIVWSAVLLAGISVAAMLAMKGLFAFFDSRRTQTAIEKSALLEGRELPPEPRLQVKPETDLKQIQARTDSVINSYGWVVREAGVVRIPIEQAMDLALQRGFPVRPENNRGEF